MKVNRTLEFESWFDSLAVKERAQIDARLQRIEQYKYFGDTKDLGEGLAELRWKNGRRLYFTRVVDNQDQIVLVLSGGLKNAQKEDIKQARLLVRKYAGI